MKNWTGRDTRMLALMVSRAWLKSAQEFLAQGKKPAKLSDSIELVRGMLENYADVNGIENIGPKVTKMVLRQAVDDAMSILRSDQQKYADVIEHFKTGTTSMEHTARELLHVARDVLAESSADRFEKSTGQKMKLHGQGKVVAELQSTGFYLIMFPDGNVEEALDKPMAERRIRKYFKDTLGTSHIGIGSIECLALWEHDVMGRWNEIEARASEWVQRPGMSSGADSDFFDIGVFGIARSSP